MNARNDTAAYAAFLKLFQANLHVQKERMDTFREGSFCDRKHKTSATTLKKTGMAAKGVSGPSGVSFTSSVFEMSKGKNTLQHKKQPAQYKDDLVRTAANKNQTTDDGTYRLRHAHEGVARGYGRSAGCTFAEIGHYIAERRLGDSVIHSANKQGEKQHPQGRQIGHG